jgi:hypothetical protein
MQPVMEKLRDCLCAEIDAKLAPVCFCGVIPGSPENYLDVESPDPEQCGGSAWVRLQNTFRSSRLPEVETANSELGFLAATFEVGIIRLVQAVDEDGQAPSVETDLASVSLILADMEGIERAITCCFGEDYDWALGTYTPSDGLGGVVGGAWTVAVRVR